MKKIFKIILILFVGFLIGVILFPFIFKSDPFATLTFRNTSSKNIKFIKIIDEARENIQLVEDLPIGKSKNANFYVAGEGAYQLQVVFNDDSVVSRGPSYVESGYKVTETIKDNKIETHIDLY